MGPILGVSMGPHDDVGVGLCVGAVLGHDSRMTVGPQTRRIYSNNWWHWVRTRRMYPIWEQSGNGQLQYDGTEQKERGEFQHGALASIWTKILCKRMCCFYEASVGRVMRKIVDMGLIRGIGTTLLTGLGGIISISKWGGGGWRRPGATMDASLEAW